MKIFVSGAAGFIGRHVVSELSGRGHEVVGLARDNEGAGLIEKMGGKPVVGDLFKSGPWCGEIMSADKVISLTQPFEQDESIPLDKMGEYGRNHAEAVTNLIKAAYCGAPTSIVLTWDAQCYGNRHGQWTSDTDAINPIGHCRPLSSSFKAIERIAEDSELNIVNVYPARVYGSGGWFASLVKNMISGKARVVEPGDNWLSLIHVDDLAAFYALAVEKLDSSACFSVSDHRPVRQKDLLNFIADMIGKQSPPMADFDTYAMRFGMMEAEAMSASTRVPGINAIESLGFVPKHRSYETGVVHTLQSMGIEPRKALLEAA